MGRALRHAVREPALAGRAAHQLQHDQASGSSGCTSFASSRRAAVSTCCPPRSACRWRPSCASSNTTSAASRDMQRLPDAVVIIDLKTEEIGLREADRLEIPIVGLVDTNCDPTPVDYVIPGNDDAIRSCELIIRTLGGAIEGSAAVARGGGAPPGRGGGAEAQGGRGAQAPRGGGKGQAGGRGEGEGRSRGQGQGRGGRQGAGGGEADRGDTRGGGRGAAASTRGRSARARRQGDQAEADREAARRSPAAADGRTAAGAREERG